MIHTQSSNAIEYIVTDLVFGRVNVKFQSGHWYHYTNVSRRAILNLRMNPNMSLGFWANTNLVNSRRAKCAGTLKFAF